MTTRQQRRQKERKAQQCSQKRVSAAAFAQAHLQFINDAERMGATGRIIPLSFVDGSTFQAVQRGAVQITKPLVGRGFGENYWGAGSYKALSDPRARYLIVKSDGEMQVLDSEKRVMSISDMYNNPNMHGKNYILIPTILTSN